MQQEVDLLSLYKDVASAYVQQCNEPSTIRHCIDRALRIAHAERTVTAVIIPADVQDMEAVPEQPPGFKAVHTGVGFVARPRASRRGGSPAGGRRAQRRRAGSPCSSAPARSTPPTRCSPSPTPSERASPRRCSARRRARRRPLLHHSIGLLGTKPSWDMMQEADTLLMVGSAFPYSNFLPPVGRARGVQVDLSARMLSLRYPMEVNLCGDSRATLRGAAAAAAAASTTAPSRRGSSRRSRTGGG